jgi:hypothetical protein
VTPGDLRGILTGMSTSPEDLKSRVQQVTKAIAGLPLDSALETKLNAQFPAGGDVFRSIEEACRGGIAAGFLCTKGEGKRKFGRIFEPAEDLAGFSLDVVDIDDLEGNYHRHPTGEIDLIMPQSNDATFDNRGAGWMVYPPGSGHRPTVKKGRALILYLLPQGRIEWTKAY